jgi:hypothetical protein
LKSVHAEPGCREHEEGKKVAVRDEVREFLDTMPEEELIATKRYIEFLQSGYADMLQWLLDTAPEDDEPTIPEEDAAAAEAWAEFERGEGISADEIKRTLLR